MKNTVTFAKSLLALGAVLTFAAPTLAQVPAAPAGQPVPAGHKRSGPKQFETLGLSQAQKDQIKAIAKKGHEQTKAIKANTSLTPDQQKAKIKEVHEANRAAMMNVLTPAQKEKLAAEMKSRKSKGGKQAKLRGGARIAPASLAAPATGK